MSQLVQPLGLRAGEPTEVFVDGPALYLSLRALNFDIDYKGLRDHIRNNSSAIAFHYFNMYREDDSHQTQMKLMDFLEYNGWRVHTRALREYTDQGGRVRSVGSITTMMALRFARCTNKHVILFGSAAEYDDAVLAARENNCRVTVVSTTQIGRDSGFPRNPNVFDELRRTADDFVDLNDLIKANAPFMRAPRPVRAGREHEA